MQFPTPNPDGSVEPPGLIRDALGVMETEVYDCNVANGWFDDSRTFGDDIALLHTEVSEMFEAFRDWGLDDTTESECDKPFHDPGSIVHGNHVCKPQGVGSEAADVLVRLLDTCRRHDVDLAAEFVRKMAYNRTRGYKHGGKTI